METSDQFFLPKISDYWDSNKAAIENWGAVLQVMDHEQLKNSITRLVDAITEHTRVLDDALIQRVAFVMADDLYRTASRIKVWNDGVGTYLRSTAGIFLQLLAMRGFSLHYVVDNTFPDTQRPFDLFPSWFSACGMAYECPQLRTFRDRVSSSEARRLCNAALQNLDGRFHYVILDTDSAADSFAAPLSQMKHDKIITVIRTEAPLTGSNITVSLSGHFVTKPSGLGLN